MFKCYLGNPEATRLAFVADSADGVPWLRTGDIGCMSADGRLYIVDRAKDIIKVRGWQISPVEIEDVVRMVDGVKDVAVAGTKMKDGVELPRAYVVLQDKLLRVNGETAADFETRKRQEIQEMVIKTLASWKRLDGGVKFVDQIPRGPSGKILRKILREIDQHDETGKSREM
jgi:4-coumarate--CoA ligase